MPTMYELKKSDLCYIHPGADVSPTASLGDYVVVYPGAFIAGNSAVLGFTQIWRGVRLNSGASLGPGITLEQPVFGRDGGIVFGSDCRVGAGAIIYQGVTIGEGAVIKPGSVVEQNVPPYAIVSGAPARVVGYVENLQVQQARPWHLQATFPDAPAVVRLGVGDVTLHRLKKVCDPRGDLSVGEFPTNVPFEPKRYFLVFNVPSEKTRGEHAHHECHQFLICVKGSCAVVVDDGESRCEVLLESPDMGIYLPPMTWGIQYKYSSDAVLLVFTSDYYDANDYIRNYADFVDMAHRKKQN